MYAYVRLCAYKEWLDAFPGVRDYVNTRGQVWIKIFSCPKSYKKLKSLWIRALLLFIWSIEIQASYSSHEKLQRHDIMKGNDIL